MPTATRLLDRAAWIAQRQARDAGDEFRERRLTLGVSQNAVSAACRMSRNRYGAIENGRCRTVTLDELNRIAAVLGLATSFRLYPAGPSIRDAGHARRLQGFIALVRPPLRCRLEVPLPRTSDRPEQRAWDAVLLANEERAAVELEMRLRDMQALKRRLDLKRRDDPTSAFLLLIADTRSNRRVLSEFADLFDDLPRLRPSTVAQALGQGRLPPSGMLLI